MGNAMDEVLKLKRLEHNVSILQQKVASHESLHESAANRIDAVEKLVTLHEQSLEAINKIAVIAQDTYDVIKPLAKALRWLAIAGGWVAKIAAGVAIIWHAAKWVAAKTGVAL